MKSKSVQKESSSGRCSSGKMHLQKRFLILLVPVLLLLALLIAAVPGAVQREHRYREAVDLLKSGDLDGAEYELSRIPSYRDSEELLQKEIPYLRAVRLLDAANAGPDLNPDDLDVDISAADDETTVPMLLYQAASDAFISLGDYKDCASLASDCSEGIASEKTRLEEARQKKEQELLQKKQDAYDRAAALLEAGDYSAAQEQFLSLGDYADSAAMVQECRYQKAVSLYSFLSRYDVGRIYASLTVEPGETCIFSLSSDEALRLGSSCVDEMRSACGQDESDVRLEDKPPKKMQSLKDALKDLFVSLGEYADSASYPEKIDNATDYTRDFFMLCSTGDLPGAKAWLKNYGGVFPNKKQWSKLLSLYAPYCGTWNLYLGDAELLAYSVGKNEVCMSVTSRVILTEDEAFLRLSFGSDNQINFDLPTEYGEAMFINTDVSTGNYMAALNNGHLVYMRYDQDWELLSSSDYIPA